MKILAKTKNGYVIEIDNEEISIICSDYDANYNWRIGANIDLDVSLMKLKEVITDSEMIKDIDNLIALGQKLEDAKNIILSLKKEMSKLLETHKIRKD